MEGRKSNKEILIIFANRCIDDIINHKRIEGISDVKSLAEYASLLNNENEKLINAIDDAAEHVFNKLTYEENDEMMKCIRNSFPYEKYNAIEPGSVKEVFKEWGGTHFLKLIRNSVIRCLEEKVSEK